MADAGLDVSDHADNTMNFVSRFIPLASAAVLLASAAHGQARTTVPGWTITTNMTFDSGDASRRTSMAMREQATERYLRMEFVQMSGFAAGAPNIEGMYTLLDIADSTMTSVMPAQHMATVTSLNVFDAATSPVISRKQHLTRSNLEDLGDGGRILGHATHRYRLTTAGTVEMTLMGQTCTSALDAVSELWIAPDVDLGFAGEASLKYFGANSMANLAAQDGVASATMPKGTALKTVSAFGASDAGGKRVTVTATVEIVELSRSDLDTALFSVPPEIQKMDMRKILADLPPGAIDSAVKASAASGERSLCK